MTGVGEQPQGMEARMGNVELVVTGLRKDVDGLRTDVQKLRVLEEENARRITLIAEVQTHHGTVLERLVKDVEPLKVLPDLVQRVVQDHERRIRALERRRRTNNRV